MTIEIMICLSIVAVAIFLFAIDRIPPDVIALGVMLAVIATGLVKPADAFAGFGSDTVIMILGLLIMTAGLSQTGVVDAVGRNILGFVGDRQHIMLPSIMVSAATMSAFMSNTAATAFFVPVILGVAARSKTSPSKYLLPLAFSSILTSSVTLISTSTNIVVSELLVRKGQPEIGMFELSPVGIPIALVGLAYVYFVGVRLMPAIPPAATELVDLGDRLYQADMIVPDGSILVGKVLAKSTIGDNSGFSLVKLLRAGMPVKLSEELVLEAGDVVIVEGLRTDLLKVKGIAGIELKADVHLARPDLEPENLAIVEGVLMPNSPLIGKTLKSTEFNDRYGLQVLSLNRSGVAAKGKLSRMRLRLGDVLLLQGTADNVKALERGHLFSIFGGLDSDRPDTSKATIAIIIYAVALLAATLKVVALPVAVLGGAFVMLLTRCLSPEEAYRRIEWKVLILIGSLLSLGVAMDTSGTGQYVASLLVDFSRGQSPYVLLGGFFLLTVALTQPMSNQAAAIVVVPLAIETALQLGLNPRTFAMMVAVAASCSYLTPLEPSSLMVYGPGKYRFADFVRVGLPLTVVIFVIALLLVPRVWELTP